MKTAMYIVGGIVVVCIALSTYFDYKTNSVVEQTLGKTLEEAQKAAAK
jgi:hypothetical protein